MTSYSDFASAHPTPPESIMDAASPPPDFINPQDISHESQYQLGMTSRSTSVSNSAGPQVTFDDDDDSSEPPKKKRKSWGQVLPKPTTNLPPRKRAKTDEEKAQRKYERVQRNRHAAHMSRMRKQDEMENLRLENERLVVDNNALEDEVQRLRAELAGRPIASANQAFNPQIKAELDLRPMTPPESDEPLVSAGSPSTSPQSVPALSYSSTASQTSVDLDDQTESRRPLFSDNTILDPSTVNPADLKQSDVSRSAETCSLQWTSDSHKVLAPPNPRRSLRIRVKTEDD